MTPALFKALHGPLNFYYKSRHIQSVKHGFLGSISDRQFLLKNIIKTSENSGIRLSEEILDVYEQQKHIDKLSTCVKIGKLNITHTSEYVISLGVQDMKATHRMQSGTVETGLVCQSIDIDPYQKGKKLLPLAAIRNLNQQKLVILPTSELNTLGAGFKEQYNYRTADKLELCLNFEIILDLTRDILNYYTINQVFSRKWSVKYCILGVLKKFYESAINCPASIKSREAQVI